MNLPNDLPERVRVLERRCQFLLFTSFVAVFVAFASVAWLLVSIASPYYSGAFGDNTSNTSGNATILRDGRAAILKRGDQRLVVIPTRQQSGCPQLTYRWRHWSAPDQSPTDGDSVANEEHGSLWVNIGDISFEWSTHTTGSGWIYYGNSTGNLHPPVEIAVTDVATFDEVNPYLGHWTFRSKLDIEERLRLERESVKFNREALHAAMQNVDTALER